MAHQHQSYWHWASELLAVAYSDVKYSGNGRFWQVDVISKLLAVALCLVCTIVSGSSLQSLVTRQFIKDNGSGLLCKVAGNNL